MSLCRKCEPGLSHETRVVLSLAIAGSFRKESRVVSVVLCFHRLQVFSEKLQMEQFLARRKILNRIRNFRFSVDQRQVFDNIPEAEPVSRIFGSNERVQYSNNQFIITFLKRLAGSVFK